MTGPRFLGNQRRAVLNLVVQLERRLVPGVPFVAEITNTLGANRQFGSRDRRLYRELLYGWLRFKGWFDAARKISDDAAADVLIALAQPVPDVAALQESVGTPGGVRVDPLGWPLARERLEALVPDVDFSLPALLPSWFRGHCPALYEDREILFQVTRPPLWLRAQQGTGAHLVKELARTGIDGTASDRFAAAVRIAGYPDLEDHPLITGGAAEVQDIGSQALLAMAVPARGSRWLDLCAGAGGKSLQLADLVGPEGHVTAHDVRRDALMELRRRMLRSPLRNITAEPILPEPGLARFDGVLVDAPCSASGTWRRHPHLRHQVSLPVIRKHARDQLDLLQRGASYVAPGGRLVYATCSLSRHENEDVVTAFLKENRDFGLEPPPFAPGIAVPPAGWVTLMPSELDSDGYFLACLRHKGTG